LLSYLKPKIKQVLLENLQKVLNLKKYVFVSRQPSLLLSNVPHPPPPPPIAVVLILTRVEKPAIGRFMLILFIIVGQSWDTGTEMSDDC
jgi:hypothetical protein